MENPQLDKHVIRTDPLTGSKNLIAFSEALSALCSDRFLGPFSLATMDVNRMVELNRLQGHVKGDTVLRWMALLAQDGLETNLYRIGGDEFVAILTGKDPQDLVACALEVYERLNTRAADFSLQAPIASMSVIHFTGTEQLAPVDIFARIYGAIAQVKSHYNRTFRAFQVDEIDQAIDFQTFRLITNRMIDRVIYLGARLDESLELAFTDPVTGLPNMRMAQRRLDQLTSSAALASQTFALLLIDGDDLRRYNEISYAAGDVMIYQLGETIRLAIRPEDFLARWKVGDEFLVLLDGADPERAVAAGERICKAVEEVSRVWKLPVTVSVGVAAYPLHGKTPEQLIRTAELANSESKKKGKNRVTSFSGKNHYDGQ